MEESLKNIISAESVKNDKFGIIIGKCQTCTISEKWAPGRIIRKSHVCRIIEKWQIKKNVKKTLILNNQWKMTNLTESLENRDRNAKKEQWNEDENEGMKKKPRGHQEIGGGGN